MFVSLLALTFLIALGVSYLLARSHVTAKRFLGQWVLATSVGWLAGVFLAFFLSYEVVNLFYPKETNLILGLCLAAGVGYSQWRTITKYFKISAWWIWASAIGIGLPFVAEVLLDEFGGRKIKFTDNEILDWFIVGVLGGLLAGLLQINIVKSLSKKGICWVVICPIAWGIGFLSTQIGIFGFFLFGGVALGVIGGLGFLYILQFPVRKDIDQSGTRSAGTAPLDILDCWGKNNR